MSGGECGWLLWDRRWFYCRFGFCGFLRVVFSSFSFVSFLSFLFLIVIVSLVVFFLEFRLEFSLIVFLFLGCFYVDRYIGR